VNYDASSLEVLKGLDPVRRRPGMYTDTARPNHLAQEVIDNAVDEAIAGFAKRINVIYHTDGSLEVGDDGRGMPTDMHPDEKMTGVEVIMTKLHAGAKFGIKNYRFSGGLHGVGVSVVNALSTRLEAEIKREGNKYAISFENGEIASKLRKIGTVGKRNTGSTVRFWPDEKYFDTAKFSLRRLKHVLRAKAVLCPRLKITFTNKYTGETDSWYFEDGLRDYLLENLSEYNRIPEKPFIGHQEGKEEVVSWAVIWLPEQGQMIAESYVNLIPTTQGGTHVNGFRSGLLAAVREFCEFRNLVPRGIKLAPDESVLVPVNLHRLSPMSSETPLPCGSTITPKRAKNWRKWPLKTRAKGSRPPKKSYGKKWEAAPLCRANWQIALPRIPSKASFFW
jgi:topoisomerase-4 subunit B